MSETATETIDLLVLDDDPIVLESLSEHLRMEGYEVSTANRLKQAKQMLNNYAYPVVLADVRLPEGDAFDLLDHINENNMPTSVIMFTGYGTISDAVRAIKEGAFDYVTKPLSDEDVNLAIERALKHQQLLEENNRLRRQLNMSFKMDNFVCHDEKMRRVLDMVKVIAGTGSTVLITGESGTGKTLVARAIHSNSPRSKGRFIEVNCGALPETLLESELFGHVKGAFSGATTNKHGKFEAADKGTIFLDEVSLASPSLQMKLLRVLESFEFEPVGSNDTRKVDVRIILATNKDLGELVEKGDFREDLYYRVNVMDIHLPPLRERPGDILPLARHFIEKHQSRATREIEGISEDAMRMLTSYDWPGNVRQLENAIEKAVVLCQGPYITPEDLDIQSKQSEDLLPQGDEILPLKEAMKKVERKLILESLEKCDGNRKEAAKLLQINRTTLYNKLHEHDLMDA